METHIEQMPALKGGIITYAPNQAFPIAPLQQPLGPLDQLLPQDRYFNLLTLQNINDQPEAFGLAAGFGEPDPKTGARSTVPLVDSYPQQPLIAQACNRLVAQQCHEYLADPAKLHKSFVVIARACISFAADNNDDTADYQGGLISDYFVNINIKLDKFIKGLKDKRFFLHEEHIAGRPRKEQYIAIKDDPQARKDFRKRIAEFIGDQLGCKLHSTVQGWLDGYLATGGRVIEIKGEKHRLFEFTRGLPAAHGEILALNQLLIECEAREQDFIEPQCQVFTYQLIKTQGKQGQPMLACSNCTGIISQTGIQVVTGCYTPHNQEENTAC